MISQDIPKSDELAVETGQRSRAAQPDIPKADTVGYFEPHQMAKLAESGRLYVIADSVGDAASGQMAAQYAVKRILRSFYTTDTPNLQTRLLDAIRQANQEIFERNRQHPERRPLATYVTAALIHNNKLFVANVGDGRVYAVWDKDIELLTTSEATEPSASSDNGAAQETKQNGVDNIDNKAGDLQDDPKKEPEKTKPAMSLLPEKAKLPNDKATKSLALTPTPRSSNVTPLGLEESVTIDTFSRRLFAGDKVALCSGGLTGYASEPEIAEAVTLHPPSQAIERLMALAAERGNRGHLALSITKILSIPAAAHASMPMVMPTPPNWSDWETESRSSTRPLSKPVPPVPPVGANIGTRPMDGPQRKSKPVEIPLTPARSLPWRSCLLVPIILLLLCGLIFLAGSFLLSSEALASIPFINDATETLRREAEALGLLQPEPAVPPAPPLPAETTTATIVQETQPAQAATAAPGLAQGNSSPLPTPTGAAPQSPALPATAAVTATPALPTPTPTQPLPPTIEVPAGCENKARFVTDVTVEDGTEFPPGRQFEKVWRVRNEGDCPWGPGYTVRFLNSDFFATEEEVPLIEVTGPNETADISVPMVAPEEPGSYRSVWQLYDLAGQAFGPTMYLEIEVVAGAESPPETETETENSAEAANVAAADTLYDFISNAADATWLSDSGTYTVQQTPISETLELPDAGGLVAVGIAELRGNKQSERPALLTYPDLASGTIQGIYAVETPLQPTDTLAVEVGFTRLSILSDDGVIFEVVFTPDDGSDSITLLSEGVQYRDSPLATTVPLSDIEAGQTGTFTLRVLSGDSTSRDWALWIEARLVRS